MPKIGLVAGGGKFPVLFAQEATRQGYEVVCVAHQGESDPVLEEVCDRLYWIKLGQLGRLIKAFKKEGVTEVAFLGRITKTRIFRDVRPDLQALLLWRKIKDRHDDAILRAVAAELEKEGIRVVESTRFLKELFMPEGILTKRKPSQDQWEDIAFGYRMARAIGQLDIGQCVVVKDRTVLAVEAIEGTDETIRRGGGLCEKGAVVVKVVKPSQDRRFDLPSVGLKTIQTMAEVRAEVLAVEAREALFFDRPEAINLANKVGICIVGITSEVMGHGDC
ncbi:LpxI family protein [Thermosulfuriphilus sp.]